MASRAEGYLSSGGQGIVKQYSALFEKNDLGDFDKVLAAKKVAEMLDDDFQLDKESRKGFHKLFKLITEKAVFFRYNFETWHIDNLIFLIFKSYFYKL